MILKLYLIIIFFVLTFNSNAEIKEKIIQNLKNTKNLDFKFEQNVNGKIENGNCTIEYPKKLFCEYARSNNKILVSNGKSLVVKTITSYYRYPLEKTPLNVILDKNILINKIKSLKTKRGQELHITDAIQLLINDKERFIAHNFEGKYLDCGTMNGYINSSIEIGKL